MKFSFKHPPLPVLLNLEFLYFWNFTSHPQSLFFLFLTTCHSQKCYFSVQLHKLTKMPNRISQSQVGMLACQTVSMHLLNYHYQQLPLYLQATNHYKHHHIYLLVKENFLWVDDLVLLKGKINLKMLLWVGIGLHMIREVP